MTDSIAINEQFFRAKVVQVFQAETVNQFGFEEGLRNIKVRSTDGNELTIQQRLNLDNESDNTVISEGSSVVLVRTEINGEVSYDLQEIYRLDGIAWLFVAFIMLVVFVAGKKGLFSFLGLAASLVILIKWVVPLILSGYSPILVSFVASIGIATITFYLSHGFEKRTTLALISTILTLVMAFLLSLLAIHGLHLFGTGSEEAISLNFSGFAQIDLRGLLLGAIVIGTLGILDDVTITQIATVQELQKANNSLNMKELYKRGISVGRDHIASIINTLVLAYVGASFPVFILMAGWPRPLWVSLNSEAIAEEIARTLVGSMTLVIAIPAATLLAAYYYSRHKKA